MPDSKNRPKETKVTVEDLLRFKREERPNEAFWESFEQGLHEKTLQALISEKRSKGKAIWKWGLGLSSSAGVAAAVYLSVSVFLQLEDRKTIATQELAASQFSINVDSDSVELYTVDPFSRLNKMVSMPEYVADNLSIQVLQESSGSLDYKQVHAVSSMLNENTDNIYQQNAIQRGEANFYLASVPAFNQF